MIDDEYTLQACFEEIKFYMEIMMQLLEDLKGILEGNRKPCCSLVVEESLAFENRLKAIDKFIETILKLITKIQEILGNKG